MDVILLCILEGIAEQQHPSGNTGLPFPSIHFGPGTAGIPSAIVTDENSD